MITKSQRSRQQGVTLLITLMIMAALSAVVFSISAIALNEVHIAQNESGSEPAITAAEGLAEEQLFTDVRKLNTNSCTVSGTESFASSGVSGTYATSYYVPGAYNFSLSSGQEQDFYLYNPCNPTSVPVYSGVTVQLNAFAGTSATVDLCSWTNTACSTAPDSTATIAPGGSQSFALSSNPYIVAVIYGVSTQGGNFSISTTSSDPTVTGIPANQITITTTGSKNGTTRKLQTIVPQN